MAWGSHSEKEMIIGKVILEISRKNAVHNNYETDYSAIAAIFSQLCLLTCCISKRYWRELRLCITEASLTTWKTWGRLCHHSVWNGGLYEESKCVGPISWNGIDLPLESLWENSTVYDWGLDFQWAVGIQCICMVGVKTTFLCEIRLRSLKCRYF